jgi:hypothetical protein
MVAGGDHLIVVGLVGRAEARDGAPLVYHQREFGTHSRYSRDGGP